MWRNFKQRFSTFILGHLHSKFLQSLLLQRLYCWIDLGLGRIELWRNSYYHAVEHFCKASRRVQVETPSRACARQNLQPFFRRGRNPVLGCFLRSSACAELRSRFGRMAFPENVTLKGAMLPLKAANLSTGEKGVLVLTYGFAFQALHAIFDTERLKRHYWMVLEPANDRIEDPAYILFSDCEAVIEAGNPKIRDGLRALDAGFQTVKLSSSDWVDSDVFHPIGDCPKIYDLIYVANWSLNKRHSLLFSALAKLCPTIKVALVGFHWERPRTSIEAEMKRYNVAQQCEIFENVSHRELNRLLNASRINLLLSRREGGNRALYEAMFAGIPSIVISSCEGIDPAAVNEQTGILAAENELEYVIDDTLNSAANFTPRIWAEANSGYINSTSTLNHKLQQLSLAQGCEWTNDIVPKINGPNISYKLRSDSENLRPALEHLASFLRC